MKKRLTPTGQNTDKSYFYNTGEQVKKGDRVLHRKKEEIVAAGSGGDTLNPCVKLKNGKAPRVSYLTFIRREYPEAMAVAPNDMVPGSIFDVSNNNNVHNEPQPVKLDAALLLAMEDMFRRFMPEIVKEMAKSSDVTKMSTGADQHCY